VHDCNIGMQNVPLRDPRLVEIQLGETSCGDSVWCIILGKDNNNSYVFQMSCLNNCVDRGLVDTENKIWQRQERQYGRWWVDVPGSIFII
jgi:hypothetical protein